MTASLSVAAGPSAPFVLASPGGTARIAVAATEPEYVWLAAQDLARDVAALTGVSPAVVRADSPSPGDAWIATDPALGPAPEAYSVRLGDGILSFSGSDARGTMFAIYDFIETRLGIDPLAWWNGAPVPRTETLAWENPGLGQPPPRFRYRGWFVNDEDLLTGWRPSGAKRRLDYPYYADVLDPAVMDRIAEAAVRCRANLVIPASFLDLSNPAEEALAVRCARRGLILTQHHVEPLGASAFTFFNYWRARGRDIAFSYYSHAAEMEEVWREMAARWAKFPDVIWQLGLRGIADRPMWGADPDVPGDDASRAEIISRALARQVAILDEIGVPRRGRVMTMTLWAEGAALYRSGLLRVPDGVTVVAADNTPGWSWSPPLRAIAREESRRYGVYYHHALITPGPHLASLVPPARTHAMFAEAARRHFDAYAICNVSNIREFTRDLAATSRILWDPAAFDIASWQERWLATHVSDPAARPRWTEAFRLYDAALELEPSRGAPLFLDGLLQKEFRRLAAFLEGKAPEPLSPEALRARRLRLEAQRARYAEVARIARDLLDRAPAEEREFASTVLVHPAGLMEALTDWVGELAACCEARLDAASGGVGDAAAREHAVRALAAIRRANDLSADYCRGRWEGWYRDCRKIDLAGGLARTDAIVRGLEE